MDEPNDVGAEHPPALNESILLFLADKLGGDVPPMRSVYAVYEAEGWSITDVAAFEALGVAGQRAAVKAHLASKTPNPAAPKLTRPRRKSRPRQDRLMKRRHVPGHRFVRRLSIDPIQDGRLCAGAVLTLLTLISRCGKGKTYRAPTNWIAKDRAVCTRTIQNHYTALQAAGYIVKSAPDKRGCTTIYLTPACEPPEFKKTLAVSKGLRVRGAKKSSATYPTQIEEKADRRDGGGDDPAQQVSGAGLSPENPGTELAPTAHPLDLPTVEKMRQDPLRVRERRQRPEDRARGTSSMPDVRSAFALEMCKITRRFEDAFRERRERGT